MAVGLSALITPVCHSALPEAQDTCGFVNLRADRKAIGQLVRAVLRRLKVPRKRLLCYLPSLGPEQGGISEDQCPNGRFRVALISSGEKQKQI